MSTVKSLLTLTSGLGAVVALLACQSAVNLDVQYTDAGSEAGPATTPAPETDGGAIAPQGDAAPTAEVIGEELEACPCDARQGLACCVSNGKAGPSFCTTNQAACDKEHGGFFRCFGPDPNTESVCCLHRGAEKSETALASECKAGSVTVCRTDADCPNGVKCTVTTCKDNVAIGVCDGAPVCPN